MDDRIILNKVIAGNNAEKTVIVIGSIAIHRRHFSHKKNKALIHAKCAWI